MSARTCVVSGAAETAGVSEPPDLLGVKEGSQPERLLPIGPDPLGIGRDAQSAVYLNSPYVSRHHARIERRGGGVWLVDLGSRNGVEVNGRRVTGETQLRPGDVIAIADVRIQCLGREPLGEDTQVFEWHGSRDTGDREPDSDPGASSAPDAVPEASERPEREDALLVDVPLHKVWVGGREPDRRLSAQEFALLAYLWESRHRVCTREELGDAIWGRGRWEPNMLHRLVHRLKQKIEPAPAPAAAPSAQGGGQREARRYIESIPWVGYRLTP
jgi:pSer/pThr/pTyr-binding forkhead associated (FHA) protein